MPAGGFFVFGILIWLANQLSDRFEKDAARRDTSKNVCAACPSAAICHQGTAQSEEPARSAAQRGQHK